MHRRRSLWLLPAAIVAATMLAGAPVGAQEDAADPAELVMGFVPSARGGRPRREHPAARGLSDRAAGHPRQRGRLERLRRARHRDGDRAGADRRTPAVRPRPGRRRGRGRDHPADRAQRQRHLPHAVLHDRRRPRTAPTTRSRTRASWSEAEVAVPELQRHRAGRDETPTGPVGLEALANIAPGTPVAFVEQTSASGYIFPATILIQAGHRPRDRHRAALRWRPRRLGHRGLRRTGRGRRELRRRPDGSRRPTATSPAPSSSSPMGRRSRTTASRSRATCPTTSRAGSSRPSSTIAATEEGAAVLDSIYEISAFTEPNLEALEIVRQAVESSGYGG